MKHEAVLEKFSASSSGNKLPTQRPKRNIAQKSMDYSNGLLWREEKDLKKALYASLQEGKRRAAEGEVNGEHGEDLGEDGKPRRSLAAGNPNSRSNQESSSPKRARVHAQRKFAQGSTPNSPAPTPVKIRSGNNNTTNLLQCHRPKTEDFLTFLCLRGTSILPPSLDFLNNCPKSDASSDSRDQSPEPESFDTASYKDFSSKSERDKLSNIKSEYSTPIKATSNKFGMNNRQLQATKDSSDSDSSSTTSSSSSSSTSSSSSSEDSSEASLIQPKRNKQIIYGRKRKASNELEFPKNKQTAVMGRLRLLSPLKRTVGKSKQLEAPASVSALKEKYKQQRLAKRRTITLHSQKENLPRTAKGAGRMQAQKASQPLKSATKRTTKTLIRSNKLRPTRTALRSTRSCRNKFPSENKRLLRSSKIHEELSLPISRTSTQSSSTPWLRKAKLVPPILDFDSESEAESTGSVTIKQPQKHRSERIATLRKDPTVIPPKLTKNPCIKGKTSHQIPISTKKVALLSSSEHSYVKLPPPEKVSRPRTSLCKKYKNAVKRNRIIKPVRQEHDSLGRTRSSKLSENQISKPITRSASLKENSSSALDAKLENKNEKRTDQKVAKSGKHETKLQIDPKKCIKGNKRNVEKDVVNELKQSDRDQTKQRLLAAKPSKDMGQTSIDNHKLRKHDLAKSPTKDKNKTKDGHNSLKGNEKLKGNKGKQCELLRCKITKKDNKTVKDLERISFEDHKYTCRNAETREKFNRKENQSQNSSKHVMQDKNCSHLPLRKKQRQDLERTSKDNLQLASKNVAEKAFKRNLNKSKGSSNIQFQKDLSSQKSSKKVVSKILNKYSNKKCLSRKRINKPSRSDKDDDDDELKSSSESSSSDTDSSEVSSKVSKSPPRENLDKEILNQNEVTRPEPLNEETKTAENSVSAPETTPNEPLADIGCINDETANSYIIEGMSDGVATFDAISNEMAQTLPGDLVFGSAEEIQSLMTSEFSGVFDEAFTAGAILLTTRDATLAQVPLHFIQELPPTKTMADAATNTCEEDLACMNESLAKSEETSVGTQTMTPVGSPLPVAPDIPPQETTPTSNTKESCGKQKSKTVPKTSSPGSNSLSLGRRRSRTTSFSKKLKLDDASGGKDTGPLGQDNATMVDAPTFYPSEEDFQDPLEYIKKIQPEAEKYGICKIIPPAQFKPECKVNDDMRFTAHNQYVHKMLYRWGPNVKHVACVKRHLRSLGITLDQAPLIGGIELDLSKFYHTVQHFGGLQQVIEKKKWQRVADAMHIPKAAQDRVTKLYDAYCKYLVPYDTLSEDDKKRLEEEVSASYERWLQRRIRARETGCKEEDDEDEEVSNDCVTKGRSMSLSSFYRVARNTMAMWYKYEPTPEEIEQEFWGIVTERTQHLVVHAGNIDSSVYGSGFPCNRNSLFSKHPWNLKVLTNNPGSILRCMGPVSGVTIPTLHVGMLFTTGCWYRDPHSLPWIEYLHTGASKIWYSTPEMCCHTFRAAMKKIMPDCCTSNPIWLPSDTAMVPPNMLVEHGATLSRTVQDSGQFIVIFPGAFTSTICCGYTVSESVYFAPPYWLDLAQSAFTDIRSSCEPPAFSLERLLFSIANDSRTQPETLQKILPIIEEIRDEELQLRKQLYDLGLKTSERLPLLEVKDKKKRSRGSEDESEQECEVCRSHCYVSMVANSQEEAIYCLQHACHHLQKKKNLKSCKLMYTYDQAELNELIRKITEQIQSYKNCARKKSPKKKPSSP